MSPPRQSRPRYDSMKSQSSSIAPSAWGGIRPPSPSFSTTTTGSRVNLPANHMLITRKDLRQSIACLEELMAAAKAYRNALLAMSTATAAFASAMEACSRVKGCRASNSPLAGASGLQYLISNHEQILADTVYRQFEIPLLEALDEYKLVTADRLIGYEKSLHEQSSRIRKTEAENLKVGRRRKRDLQQFRQALAELQRQVDELDAIKAGYHEEVLDGEDEIWDTVLGKVAFVVRSQLDFYEKIAGKASDPILEPLVSSIPDPFDSYGPPKEEGHIISVLAPLGLLDATPQSPTPGLSRTQSTSGVSTPDRPSPIKATPFPTSFISPSKPETSTISAISAIGEHDWLMDGQDREGRARRELSVIDSVADDEERDSRSVRSRDDVGAARKDGAGTPDQVLTEPARQTADDAAPAGQDDGVASTSTAGLSEVVRGTEAESGAIENANLDEAQTQSDSADTAEPATTTSTPDIADQSSA